MPMGFAAVLRLLLLLMSGFLFACSGGSMSARAASQSEGIPWDIEIVAPFYYEVMPMGNPVPTVYGLNSKQDWTSVHTGFRRIPDFKTHKANAPGGLDPWTLDFCFNCISSFYNADAYVQPPEEIFIRYLALTEERVYELSFRLPDELQRQMLAAATGDNDSGKTCQTGILFGLLPGGEAKVWLAVCGRYQYLRQAQAQFGPMTLDASDRDYRQYMLAIEGQRRKNAASAEPLLPVRPDRLESMRQSGPGMEQEPMLLSDSRCWADKPERPLSPQAPLSRQQQRWLSRLWLDAKPLLDSSELYYSLPQAVTLAWEEAAAKGLSPRESELWVLARVVASSSGELAPLAARLQLTETELARGQQWADEFCGR